MSTELLTPEVIHNAINVGKFLLSSPAVDGVVTALMTTLFLRREERSSGLPKLYKTQGAVL